MVRYTSDVKEDVINITWKCLWLFVWIYWCFAWLSKCHQQTDTFHIENVMHGCHSRSTQTHTHISNHVPPQCTATTQHTYMHASSNRHTHQQRDVLQIAGFMHGCYRSASGGWSRWWSVLWRWPRCSDTNIHRGNKKWKKKRQQPDCCRHPLH